MSRPVCLGELWAVGGLSTLNDGAEFETPFWGVLPPVVTAIARGRSRGSRARPSRRWTPAGSPSSSLRGSGGAGRRRDASTVARRARARCKSHCRQRQSRRRGAPRAQVRTVADGCRLPRDRCRSGQTGAGPHVGADRCPERRARRRGRVRPHADARLAHARASLLRTALSGGSNTRGRDRNDPKELT